MSDECKDFISRCIERDVDKRIGSQNGLNEILEHPWFKDID